MSPSAWRCAAASVTGTSHAALGLPCQDSSLCSLLATADGDAILVVVVSDGAGSAARAEIGAQLACRQALEEIDAALVAGGDGLRRITRPWVEEWLGRFQAGIATRARFDGLEPRDFACTLIAAVVAPARAAFFQVGDGAIVISAEDQTEGYRWIFWPATGEYENLTFFATGPEVNENLQFELLERRIDEVAVLTDGLQRLALHYQSRTAHAPFFLPMLTALRDAPAGALAGLSSHLSTYLSSPVVNERTNDDKTLVLATRRPPRDGAAEPA